MQKDDEAVKVSEGGGGNDEKIKTDNFPGMIGEESLPSLGRRLRCFDPVFCDG